MSAEKPAEVPPSPEDPAVGERRDTLPRSAVGEASLVMEAASPTCTF